MTKATITRVFVGSLAALAAGVVLVIVGAVVALANGTLVMSGPDVTGFRPSAIGWSTIVFVVVGALTLIGGMIGQFVAWLGAMINTANLADKTWFILLLVLGLFSFGFIAMLVYVLAGPDGLSEDSDRTQLA
ncbi:MAG TPA: hypothetical protein VIK65_10895 [Candidatus Limnocylindrales bacterium]